MILFYKQGEQIENAKVWFGNEDYVPIVAGKDILLTLSKYDKSKLEVAISYNDPVQAPISAGDKIAELNIIKDDEVDVTIPLYAGRDVGSISTFSKVIASLDYLLFGD